MKFCQFSKTNHHTHAPCSKVKLGGTPHLYDEKYFFKYWQNHIERLAFIFEIDRFGLDWKMSINFFSYIDLKKTKFRIIDTLIYSKPKMVIWIEVSPIWQKKSHQRQNFQKPVQGYIMYSYQVLSESQFIHAIWLSKYTNSESIVFLIVITWPKAFLQDLSQMLIWYWAEGKSSLQNQLFSIQLTNMKLHWRGSWCLNILQSLCHRISEI